MRTVQETFNAAINTGLYHQHAYAFMCHALERARKYQIITWEECSAALDAIRSYITDDLSSFSGSLAGALDDAGLLYLNECPHWFEQCLAIYRDWDNRPMPEQQGATS